MKLRNLMLVLAVVASLSAQTGGVGVTLQQAIRKESVEGDLKGAIELYKKVVAGAAKDRAAAATALLRLGECYEKQGNAEAQAAYQRLVSEFSDQKDQARDAQVRLAALGQSAGGSKTMETKLIAKGVDANRFGRITPDGRSLVGVDSATGALTVRDLQTGAVRRLTDEAGRGHKPIPSHNGKQIAYAWFLGAERLPELRVINVDGSGMRTVRVQVKPGESITPLDWSLDEKSILGLESSRENNSWYLPSTIDLGTGEVHRFGRTLWDTEFAGFSPDGRWVVYSRRLAPGNPDWDIFAVDTRSGQETAVVTGASQDCRPMWVPDTDRVVFRSDRTGKNAIWMVRLQDGQAVGAPVLVKADAGDYTPLGISQDGSLFYRVSYVTKDVYQATVDPQTLRVQDAPARLVETYLGRNFMPTWSPSGDSFAYYSERDRSTRLVVHHPDGKETVAAEPVRAVDLRPGWCGNGERILAFGTPSFQLIRLFDSRTGLAVPPDLKVVTPPRVPWQPGIAPDCQSVYFTPYSEATKQRRIYRYEISTGKETNLLTETGGMAHYPTVSPDGRWLALLGRLDGGTEPGILVLPTAGGTPRLLDPEGWDPFSWTPDSKRVIYARSVKGPDGQATENELYWAPVEGGTPQSTGIRMSGASAPSLNADGRRLLFSATETSSEVWALRNWR